MNAPYSNFSQESSRKVGTAEALFIPSFRPHPVQPRLFDATAGAIEHAQRADRAEGAGLVPYKTSDSSFLDVSFLHSVVQERRINRLRRIVWACGHLHEFGRPEGVLENVWFCTLTYRPGINWEPRHISQCLKRGRKWCDRRGVPFRYVWVAELQKRGMLHYHLAIWLPKRIQLPKFDKQGWWPHGMTQRVIAENAVGYLMKYLSKISEFHEFPKGARIHGYGGLTKQARDICAWLNLPTHCKQRRYPFSYPQIYRFLS